MEFNSSMIIPRSTFLKIWSRLCNKELTPLSGYEPPQVLAVVRFIFAPWNSEAAGLGRTSCETLFSNLKEYHAVGLSPTHYCT